MTEMKELLAKAVAASDAADCDGGNPAEHIAAAEALEAVAAGHRKTAGEWTEYLLTWQEYVATRATEGADND